MKNLFTFLMVLCLSVVAIAQEPVQRSLITKRTATWCGNCGNWGWSFMEGLIDDNTDKATFIGAHNSGDLRNDFSEAFTDALGGSGQPNFFLDENKLNVGSNTYSAQQSTLKTLVDEASARTPIANTGILQGDTADGKIEMTARTEFYEDVEGEFYLTVLALEDGVINSQAGQGANTVHTNVLRGSANTNVFGEMIANGSIEKNTQVQTPFTINLDPSWEVSNLSVAFILWQKVGSDFIFVNTFRTNSIFSITSSTSQQLSNEAYTLTSNLVEKNTQLVIGSNNVVGEAAVQLVDMQGRIVKTIWNGAIDSETNLEIENNGLAAGTYLISIQIDDKIATEKIVFLR